MIVALVAVVAVSLAAVAAVVRLQAQQQAHVQRLLDAQATERLAWARERWELNTRIQSPELARMAPPAPPQAATGDAPAAEFGEDDIDESHLVGTVGAVGEDEH